MNMGLPRREKGTIVRILIIPHSRHISGPLTLFITTFDLLRSFILYFVQLYFMLYSTSCCYTLLPSTLLHVVLYFMLWVFCCNFLHVVLRIRAFRNYLKFFLICSDGSFAGSLFLSCPAALNSANRAEKGHSQSLPQAQLG